MEPSSDFDNLSSIVYHLSSIIYHLSSIIYHLPSIIYHLSSIIYHLSAMSTVGPGHSTRPLQTCLFLLFLLASHWSVRGPSVSQSVWKQGGLKTMACLSGKGHGKKITPFFHRFSSIKNPGQDMETN